MSNLTRKVPEIPHIMKDSDIKGAVEALTNAWRFRNGDDTEAFITNKDAKSMVLEQIALSEQKMTATRQVSGGGGSSIPALLDNQLMYMNTAKNTGFGWHAVGAYYFYNVTTAQITNAFHSTYGVIYANNGVTGGPFTWQLDLAGQTDYLFNTYGGGTRTGTPATPGTVYKYLKAQVDGALVYIPTYQ